MAEIGVITEQGDLGLGWDPLSQKDQKIYEEAERRHREEDQKKDKKKTE